MAWKRYWHALFEERYMELLDLVEKEAERDPDTFYESKIYRFFESVTDCIENRIFIDPSHKEFLLGNTLGKSNRHWRRAKNGLPNRYRLFFQFNTTRKSVVLAWLNHHNTLRKEGAKTDVYEVFKKMLDADTIPSDFNSLLKVSSGAKISKVSE